MKEIGEDVGRGVDVSERVLMELSITISSRSWDLPKTLELQDFLVLQTG